MKDRSTIGELNWQIATFKKERDDLKYIVERYADFWEWYEDKYGMTQKELFDEFEKHEDKINNENTIQSNNGTR